MIFEKYFAKKRTDHPPHVLLKNREEREQKSSAELLAFLEDRQVLYKEINERCPRGIIRSVTKIRAELHRQLKHSAPDSELFGILSNMRESVQELLAAACRDCPDPKSCEDCAIFLMGCPRLLFTFRRQMGDQIHRLCSHYKLRPDDCLKDILPKPDGTHRTCGVFPKLLG